MLLFYIRHGDPIYAPNQLTPLGKRQAEAVAKRLALYGVDRIYASTSNRAVETAQPTAELLKLPIEQLHWCNETLAGNSFFLPTPSGQKSWFFQQKGFRELACKEEVRLLGKKWYTHADFAPYNQQFCDGIERVRKELDAFLSELGYQHNEEGNCYEAIRPNDERIALFAHQGFGTVFMSCLLDIPYPLYSIHFDMGHSGMTVIEFPNKIGNVVPCVLQFSNDSHLYREGLPTNYQNRIRF